MGFWNIFGNFATSDTGETIQRISGNTSISTNGTVYTTTGPFTNGSDGSSFTQMGNFSSDGSVRMGNTATGLGAVFTRDKDSDSMGHTRSGRGPFGDDGF